MRHVVPLAQVISLALISAGPADEPRPPAADPTPPTEWVADPRWRPAPGRMASVAIDGVPMARTPTAWDNHVASRRAGDVAGIDRAYADGSLVRLSRGTRLLILRDHAPERPAGTLSSAGLAASLLDARPADRDGFPVEVRIIDGPHAGGIVFADRGDIAARFERRIAPVLNPGDHATVARPETYLAGDRNDLHDLEFARIDGDRARIGRLVAAGSLARLNAGVKVVVIGRDGEAARVRVHSGSRLAGATGYVPAGDLVPPPGPRATGPAAR